jgi:hypothetical protein
MFVPSSSVVASHACMNTHMLTLHQQSTHGCHAETMLTLAYKVSFCSACPTAVFGGGISQHAVLLLLQAEQSGCALGRAMHVLVAAANAHPKLDRELLPVNFFQADGPAHQTYAHVAFGTVSRDYSLLLTDKPETDTAEGFLRTASPASHASACTPTSG